ncbi:MAG: glutathione S-transferase family protein [Myxococcota bacterium]
MSHDTPHLELFQFPHSHFNEKARWGLDWKQLPHVRTSLLPGPHALRVRRLCGGTETPVLRVGGREGAVVAGSAAILAELERLKPEPRLWPEDPADAARALEVQSFFDEEVGPPLRRAAFSLMIDHPDYLCGMFAGERSAPVRWLYRASFPLARGMMSASMGLDDPRAVEEGFATVRRALGLVVEEAGPEGYLAGPRFSVADLTAASLLAPVADPPGSPMERPRPLPAGFGSWLEELAGHPGVAWVRGIYRKHRPTSSSALASGQRR